jgi:hypothetical protein
MGKEGSTRAIAEKGEIGGLRRGTVELVFDREVNVESLQKALLATVRWYGCVACGLNGLDLRFRDQDPLFEQFKDIEGLRDINVYR